MTTEILGLDELAPSQGSPDVTHNNALRQMEGRLVRALDKDLTVAPSTPTAGDAYIVATGATGTWSGKDKKIAHFWGGSWKYYTPRHGNSLMVIDENRRYFYNDTDWVMEPAGAMADGDYGDVTVSSSGTVMTIDNDVVTYAKMQNVSATDKLLGRSTSGSGDVEEIACTAAGRALIDDADAAAQRTTLGLGTVATLASDTDGTLAANSDSRVATQKAVKTYADSLIAANDAMVFKGVQDCSANPNYPAADRGHTYRVSVAGMIGGASGINVEVGDMFMCLTDGTSSGNQATVGSSWSVIQANLDGAVIGPASATDNHVAVFDGTTGKLIKSMSLSAAIDLIGSTQGSILYRNGSAWVVLTPGTSGQVLTTQGASANPIWNSPPVSISVLYPGVPTASVLVALFAAPAGINTITFAAAISGSSGKALTAATAQTDFDVRKNATTSSNGTSVGTIRFAAAGSVPTFIAASGFTLTGGTDTLSVWGPATPDATLANIDITLYGTRN